MRVLLASRALNLAIGDVHALRALLIGKLRFVADQRKDIAGRDSVIPRCERTLSERDANITQMPARSTPR